MDVKPHLGTPSASRMENSARWATMLLLVAWSTMIVVTAAMNSAMIRKPRISDLSCRIWSEMFFTNRSRLTAAPPRGARTASSSRTSWSAVTPFAGWTSTVVAGGRTPSRGEPRTLTAVCLETIEPLAPRPPRTRPTTSKTFPLIFTSSPSAKPVARASTSVRMRRFGKLSSRLASSERLRGADKAGGRGFTMAADR